MSEEHGRDWKRVLGALAGGIVLMVMGWSMADEYNREPKRALSEGIPGVYTLESCREHNQKKYCRSSFRSDAGRVWETVSAPANGHESGGVDVGDSFPARFVPPPNGAGDGPAIARSDEVGRTNITQMAVSLAGLGVIGASLLGFTLRGALMRRYSDKWETIGFFLGVGVFVGIVMYVVWWVLGNGL